MPVKRILEIDPLDRPREKIEKKGASSLKDYELIAAILGMGTKKSDVLSVSRKVSELITKDEFPGYEKLLEIDGIGKSKAALLMACFEFTRRYGNPASIESIRITEPDHICQIPEIMNLRNKNQEHFLCTTLNGASEVIATRTITMLSLIHI